ncbi:MAG: sigma-70 family RNA polymerase sigma factor, partial [Phycisphaerae bacterium]|nr:sigma-70 family RNA polymerase sigma factor [Phycisphaerae bacterium]
GVPKISLEDCILDSDRSSDELVADRRSSDSQPESQMLAGELAEIVQQRIASLPDQQRLALILFSIEQLPQKEVAAIMKCSVEAVKWHVFQARKKLRAELVEYL